jgi:beta-phosphoglucomutase-like phosphatase (HAD superfamily)
MRNWLAPTMGDCELPKAAIFDLDGTFLDSVDLHALAWQEALLRFGHDVSFEKVRSQIGKGGDKLIPVFLSAYDQRDHGEKLEERPFSAVPNLLRRVREAGLQIAMLPRPRRMKSTSTSTSLASSIS